MSLATAAAASLILTGHFTVEFRINTADAFAGVGPIRTRGAKPPRFCGTSTRLSSTTVIAPTSMASMEPDAEETHRVVSSSVSDVDGSDEATDDIDDAIRVGARVVGGTGDHPPHRFFVGGDPSRCGIVSGGESVPSTWKHALYRFFIGDAGPPLVMVAVSGFVYARLQLLAMMPYSLSEFAIFAIAVVVWWVQEYFFHRMLLHSSSFDWIGKSIHRLHHERDYFHVSIDPPILLLGWLFAAHLAMRSILPWHASLSATVGYALAGLAYEWSHYIVHTRVKPPSPESFVSRLFLQMRDNHIRHHRVDDRYWYAFSVPAMDDLFDTNPNVKDLRVGNKEDIKEWSGRKQ